MSTQPEFYETIVDVMTGQTVIRPFTKDEIKAQKEAIARLAAEVEQKLAEEQTKNEARKTAEVKLAALGLTPEDLSALLS